MTNNETDDDLLKTVKFQAIAGGRVVYCLRKEGVCVVSGFIGDRMATSTINAVEKIIEAIAQQEGVKPESLKVYDLQTYTSYSDKAPGEFELDHVTFSVHGGRVVEPSWSSSQDCPAWILEVFSEQIGPNPYHQSNPGDRRP